MNDDKDFDRAWLARVAGRLSDRRYDRLVTRMIDGLGDPARGLTVEQIEQHRSYYGSGPEPLLARLFESALAVIPSVDLPDPDLLLCIAPIPTINGFALPSPRTRTPTIVLNLGMIEYFSYAIHLLLGLTGWKAGEAYCDHHSDAERIHSLFFLGEASAQGLPAVMIPAGATDCIGRHGVAMVELHDDYCLLAELFVILHELGHVVRGHLRPDDVAAMSSTLPDIALYNRSQLQEFEADAYAVSALLATIPPDQDGLSQREAIHAIGMFFAFAAVLEEFGTPAYETHPPPLDRWRRVRGAAVAPSEGRSRLDSIDHFFDWLDTAEWVRELRSHRTS